MIQTTINNNVLAPNFSGIINFKPTNGEDKALITPRNLKTFTKTYRMLQLTMNRLNDGFLIALPGHKVCNVIITTASLYGSIRLIGQINFFAYSIFPLLFISCLIFSKTAYCFGGELNKKSEVIRKSLKIRHSNREKHSRKDEELKKILTSCRDLKLRIWNFYDFESSTSSTYTNFILQTAITLLLTF